MRLPRVAPRNPRTLGGAARWVLTPLSARRAAVSDEGDEKARSAVTDPRTAGPSTVMTGEITRSFATLWMRYAGVAPGNVRTELRGDVVTCVLVNAVEAFESRTAGPHSEVPRSRDAARGTAGLTLAGYKREAVETVVRLTRQRVASFLSSHDRDTNVATEIFTLEPPPRARGRSAARPRPSQRRSNTRAASFT